MSNVVKWLKSGAVELTNFKPLAGEDSEEDGDERETIQDDELDPTPKTDRGPSGELVFVYLVASLIILFFIYYYNNLRVREF